MNANELEKIYKDANALLSGHFLLSSGKHSPNYLQSAKVLENPRTAELLAKELAKQIREYFTQEQMPQCICSPALGGILAGYELARALGVRFIFTERVGGEMTLRRGFCVEKGERILVCEDIITTGGSAAESAFCAQELGAKIIGYAALANRGIAKRVGSELSGDSTLNKLDMRLPFFAIADFVFDTYEPHNCPLCESGTKAIKPGSRGN